MSRLNDLREVYDELTSINFDFNTLPANSKYRKYYEWRSNPANRELPDSSVEPRLRDKIVGVQAFGLPDGAANKLEVRMSGRAFNFISDTTNNFGGLSAVYGIEDTTLDDYSPRTGFVPAKVVAGKLITAVSRTSNITGKSYKKRVDDTFTVPFGRVTPTSTEFERQDVIITQLFNNYTVTFKPEKLKRSR